MDKATAWTDKQLKALERQINAEYTKAYKEMKKEMAAIMEKVAANPEMSLQQKMVLMNKYDRLNKLCDEMADVLKNTNATAANFVSKSAQNIFAQNYAYEAARLSGEMISSAGRSLVIPVLDNTAVRNILIKQVDPFTQLAIAAQKDKAAIMRKLKSELTTAILKGESIPHMAERLKNVSQGYLSNTIRIARTETTRVMNSAKQTVGEKGKSMGLDMWKRWQATYDARTRDDHTAADGQEVPVDEPFEVGGELMMFPGDVSLGASGGNTINCRCVSVNFVKRK